MSNPTIIHYIYIAVTCRSAVWLSVLYDGWNSYVIAILVKQNAKFNDMLTHQKIFSMQDFLGIKKPRCFHTGDILKCNKPIDINQLPARQQAVQKLSKTNEEKANSLPPGGAYCKKVRCRQNGICLQYYLSMVKPGMSGSTITPTGIGLDQMAKVKDLQMSIQELHRRIAEAALRVAIYYRTLQPVML